LLRLKKNEFIRTDTKRPLDHVSSTSSPKANTMPNKTTKYVLRNFDFSKKKKKRMEENLIEDELEDERIDTELDCRNKQERMKPTEDLEEVCLDLTDTTKIVKIEKGLDGKIKGELI
jgi:hypothetical protein